MELILAVLLAQAAEPTEGTSPGAAQTQTAGQDTTGTKAGSGVWTYGENQQPGVKKTYGYRVQVFATIYKDKADRIRSEVQEKVSYPVYVEEIAPFYKVRIGDFQKREDAEQFLTVVQKSLGYPDAFVAETVINIPEAGKGQ